MFVAGVFSFTAAIGNCWSNGSESSSGSRVTRSPASEKRLVTDESIDVK